MELWRVFDVDDGSNPLIIKIVGHHFSANRGIDKLFCSSFMCCVVTEDNQSLCCLLLIQNQIKAQKEKKTYGLVPYLFSYCISHIYWVHQAYKLLCRVCIRVCVRQGPAHLSGKHKVICVIADWIVWKRRELFYSKAFCADPAKLQSDTRIITLYDLGKVNTVYIKVAPT